VDVFAPTDENGNARSVKNQDAQVYASELERIIEETKEVAAGKRLSRPLLSSLAAELGRPDEFIIEVYGDTEENNGVYRKVGAPGTGSYVKDGPLPQADVSNLTARVDQKLLPLRELVVEGTKLLIPSMYYWIKGNPQIASPLDGSLYWEVNIQTAAAQVRWYYWSNSLAAAGGNPIVVVEEGNNPQVSSAGLVLIGHSINGQVTTDLPIVGGVAGGVARNQWLEGKFPEAVEWLDGTTTYKAASATMAALGFADVYNNTAAAPIYMGLGLEERTTGGEAIFARLWLHQPTPAAADPTINLFAGEIYQETVVAHFLKEKQIDANTSIWILRGRISPGIVADRLNVGVSQGSARNWEVAGLQLAIGKGYIGWIARDDFPALSPGSYRPIYGPDMWLISGRKMPLYIENLVGRRDDRSPVVAGGFYAKDVSRANYTFVEEGWPMIKIDPDECGEDGRLELYPTNGTPDVRYRTPTEVHVAKSLDVPKTIRVLSFSDSQWNRGTGTAVGTICSALNVIVDWQGSIRGADGGGTPNYDYYADATGQLGEAREGRRYTDFVGITIDRSAPVANNGFAAYNASSKQSKIANMPILRSAVQGDPPDRVNNNVRMDLVRYKTGIGMAADPHAVIWALITNDEAFFPIDEAIAKLKESIRISFLETREAFPNAAIAWAAYAQSVSNLGYKAGEHKRLIEAGMNAVRALNDPKAYIIPIWAHQSAKIGYPLDPAAFPDANFAIRARLADSTHWVSDLSPGRQWAAECYAGFICDVAKGI
jgi:hypothetical protein